MMETKMRAQALSDIDRVLQHKPTASDGAGGVKQERSMMFLACIERWAPLGSAYRRQATQLAAAEKTCVSWHLFEGILVALRATIAANGLSSFAALVHAEIFADLLAHATELNEMGFSLPAMVVAGAALEQHLRRLADAAGLAPVDGRGAPRTAAALNSELYSAVSVYSKAEHAQVDAWQKCRNSAAHGEPSFAQTFSQGDIRRAIDGIRDFIVKYPA
jgi:hypothetical protein